MGFFIMDGDGFSGGIWCLWKKDEWQVNVIKNHKQFVHMNIAWNNSKHWYFTAV